MWKFSNVIPIYKSGPRTDISNYRPVCISNNFSKIFDSMLAKIITSHVSKSIIPEQHGFCQGRSTETNLFLFTNFINNCMEDGSAVDCVYTDLKKAFDKVPVNLLLFKLKSYYNIGEPLLSCLSSYLSGRYQQVTITGHYSQPFQIHSGVGQGTHLGPVLFILFINDIYSAIKFSNFLLFADDCKIFKRIDTYKDQCDLQSDLTSFTNWCRVNGLELNVGKCRQMKFSRQLSPLQFAYKINDSVVESVASFKDLGVYMDPKLNFGVHIDVVVSKASKLLGFINRSTKGFSNIRCLIILFVSIVRPVTEYCSVVWAPSYITHIDRIEKVLKRFIRTLCLKCGLEYSSQNYDRLLCYFGLPRLSCRRSYRDIMFLFKVLNNFIKCPELVDLIQLHVPSQYNLRHHPFVDVEFHRTNYGIHSPLVRVSNLINNMHLDGDMFSRSLSDFKVNLMRELYG